MAWRCESSETIDWRPGACSCCGRDLGTLRSDARFCPNCGSRVPPPPRRHFTLLRQILPLIHFSRDHAGDGPANTGPAAVVIGYAKAMYRLGWRYERGYGTPKNLPEATRCYSKSARLGNLDAKIRLAPLSASPQTVVPIVESDA